MLNALTPMHIILIALVALLLFGPNKLPELGRGFGKMFREFKDATTGKSASDDQPHEPEAPKKELTVAAPSQTEVTTQPTSGKSAH